jgi:P27 family predicted phage terminase small subunit
MRGRKPKPTARKRLEGNPGKRALPAHEPQPPAQAQTFSADDLPPELADSPVAAAEWLRLAPMLYRIRLVTDADRSALLALCLEWARYLDASAQVRKLGMVVKAPSGYPMPNPFLSIATKALAGCLKLWPELGLTPSGRVRLADPSNDPAPIADAFAEFDTLPAWH